MNGSMIRQTFLAATALAMACAVTACGGASAGAERRQLLAAFNGGFKLSAGAGGYMQKEHVISPLRPGFASLVIDRSGQARIGVWGRGLPAPGEAVYSVRQNLQPLVQNGRPTAASADWTMWGAPLGGGAYVARSAIGQDASGDLMYAASRSAVPADLAAALAGHGARIAMELDINPEWVRLDAAGTPGGALTAEISGQYHPSDQYLTGWTGDFFAVLAPPASPPGTLPPSARIRPLRGRRSQAPVLRAESEYAARLASASRRTHSEIGWLQLRQTRMRHALPPNSRDLIMPLLDAHIPLLAHCHHSPAAAEPVP